MPMAFVDLSEYPKPFVNDHYTEGLAMVIGENYIGGENSHAIPATEIVMGLRPIKGNYITRLDTEMLDKYQDYDLILIGNPCQNIIVKKVLGHSNCGMGLEEGEAIIKEVDNNGYHALIVAGSSFESLREAGFILGHYKEHDLKGNEYKIKINLGESSKETEEVTKKEPKIECDGCLVAQSCLSKGDVLFGEYCDGLNMNKLKNNGEECENDYECLSKYCDIVCKDKNNGFFSKVISFIKGIFGF